MTGSDGAPGVTVFAEVNFGGSSQEIGPGRLDIGELVVGNDAISSLRIPSGWSVTLYEHAGFQGRTKTFTADTPDVGDDFNDIASGIVVVAGEVPDTRNALTDFDFCLALTEPAVNAQLARAWTDWLDSSEFTDTLDIFKTLKDGRFVDSPLGVHVSMAPLTVDLNVSGAKPGQVRVTLHWQSGTVRYVDDVTGAAADQPVQDWSFGFVVDLERRPVDIDLLQHVSPQVHDTVREAIAHSGLPDSVFAVDCLFLDLTRSADLLADNKMLHVPPDVPQAAHDRASVAMRYFLQGTQPFLLGTVVRRNNREAVSTFAVSDFVFATNGDGDDSAPSTLAYLGMFSQRPLPADLPTALGKLTDSWVHSRGDNPTSGIMAISKDTFMNRYLIPRFTERIGSTPTPAGLTWNFTGGDQANWTSSDIIDREWSRGTNWNLAITVVPGTDMLTVFARVASHALMDGYTKTLDLGLLGSLGHYHTEWIHMEGHQDLSGTVQLEAAGTTTDFTLTPRPHYSYTGVVVDNDSVTGGANVLTAFEGAFTGSTTAERLQSQQQDLVNTLRGWLDEVLQNIQLDFGQHAFIPPGGGIFTFRRPRFSTAGDLLLDVIYDVE